MKSREFNWELFTLRLSQQALRRWKKVYANPERAARIENTRLEKFTRGEPFYAAWKITRGLGFNHSRNEFDPITKFTPFSILRHFFIFLATFFYAFFLRHFDGEYAKKVHARFGVLTKNLFQLTILETRWPQFTKFTR